MSSDTYHVKHGHYQDKCSGCHGERKSYPGLVGDDFRWAREPGHSAGGCFTPLLRQQERSKKRASTPTNVISILAFFLMPRVMTVHHTLINIILSKFNNDK